MKLVKLVTLVKLVKRVKLVKLVKLVKRVKLVKLVLLKRDVINIIFMTIQLSYKLGVFSYQLEEKA